MLIGNKQELIVWRALNQPLIKSWCGMVKPFPQRTFPAEMNLMALNEDACASVCVRAHT